jgi:hypothetical protein
MSCPAAWILHSNGRKVQYRYRMRHHDLFLRIAARPGRLKLTRDLDDGPFSRRSGRGAKEA